MNEKDLNSNESQAPVLSPETLAPKKVETPVAPEASSVEKEKPSSGKNRGKAILIGALATVVVAGGVTLAILAKAGFFAKEKEKKETVASEIETTVSNEDTSSENQGAENGQADDTGTTPSQQKKHALVTSLSQVSDDQIEKMDEFARKFFLEGNGGYINGLHPKVDIDGMYYLGMLLEKTCTFANSDVSENIVNMVYQVQVIDGTGEKQVKRQFFWMLGFLEVYQDGVIFPDKVEPMWDIVCFDNWSSNGCLTLKLLRDEIAYRNDLLEDRVKESLVQPFDGEESAGDPVLATSLDQITESMQEQLKEGAQMWMKMGYITPGVQSNGVNLENIEFAGFGLATSYDKTENRVYIYYKMDLTDLNQNPPEKRSVYWFVSFSHVYAGGQIQTSVTESVIRSAIDYRDWIDAADTVENLRKFIKQEELPDWETYEDNLVENP